MVLSSVDDDDMPHRLMCGWDEAQHQICEASDEDRRRYKRRRYGAKSTLGDSLARTLALFNAMQQQNPPPTESALPDQSFMDPTPAADWETLPLQSAANPNDMNFFAPELNPSTTSTLLSSSSSSTTSTTTENANSNKTPSDGGSSCLTRQQAP